MVTFTHVVYRLNMCLFNVNHMSQITSLLVKKEKKEEDKEYQ